MSDGYVFKFHSGAFDPNGKVGEMTEAEVLAHNRQLAAQELEAMKQTGRAVLYRFPHSNEVGSWDGSFRILIDRQSKGAHNMAGKRLDVWFTGPDGKRWHGVNIGDNDIVRCKRLGKH